MLACDATPRKRIIPPGRKPVTISAIRPNLGLEAAYQAKLDALIAEMHDSLMYWLKAAYRANQPEIAQDASPARILQDAFRRLARRWLKRFDDAAPTLARYFTASVAGRSDKALKGALKKAGMTVEFRLSAPVNDVLQATVAENVSLIKSIASEHLTQVEGIVMRSVQTGRDLGQLSTDLQARLGVAKRRAALISRDQNNKATSTIVRARQQGLGITQAIWVHSTAGRHPRPEHVAANGKAYDVAKGMFLEGVWTWPGREINCRCVSKSVIPGLST